jgi:signal transduction histidine kinase
MTAARTPQHILVVEDNLDDLMLVRQALLKHVSVVRHAATLAAALEVCAQQTPDAVLLDLLLPDSQGLATLMRLHEAWPVLPIVVLTELDGDRLGSEAIAAGAQDWFRKGDLDDRVLPRVIAYAYQRQVMLNRLVISEAQARAATHAMERTVAVVSHDLRTPLQGIRACARAVKERGQVNDQLLPMLTAIEDETTRLSDLANNLIDIQRIACGQMPWRWSTLLPSKVATDTAMSLHEIAETAGISLLAHADNHASLMGDGPAQRRLVTNLVSNSISHSGAAHITVQCEVDASKVRYLVIDDGLGIHPSSANRLGRPFATNSEASPTGGVGLGLAICLGIAAAHGGHLSIHSRRGKGTRVEAVLRGDLTMPLTAKGHETFREIDVA